MSIRKTPVHFYSPKTQLVDKTDIWLLSVAYRWGWFGEFKPPPRNSEDICGVLDRMSKKEPASRIPFVVHCVLIRL